MDDKDYKFGLSKIFFRPGKVSIGKPLHDRNSVSLGSPCMLSGCDIEHCLQWTLHTFVVASFVGLSSVS